MQATQNFRGGGMHKSAHVWNSWFWWFGPDTEWNGVVLLQMTGHLLFHEDWEKMQVGYIPLQGGRSSQGKTKKEVCVLGGGREVGYATMLMWSGDGGDTSQPCLTCPVKSSGICIVQITQTAKMFRVLFRLNYSFSEKVQQNF